MKPISEYDLSTLDVIATALSKPDGRVVGNVQFAEALRRIAGAVREYQRVSPQEEREAWDRYLAAAILDPDLRTAADVVKSANQYLEDRRERFGGSR